VIARVAQTVERYAMLRPGMNVGVAVSGGADSVCLLHILRELGFSLHILHLNHRLRGAESDADAAFVRDLAARLGLPCTVRDGDLAQAADNLEQAGRRARLSLFQEALANGTVDRVATAHTRDDQAETVLFRFLRGAGSAGLAGIRPVTSDGLVRPLIEVGRFDVERYLRNRGIEWREDSTNAGRRFARNRIRHDLLPQLERDWNPSLRETLAHTADWAFAEEQYWEGEVDRLASAALRREIGFVSLKVETLRTMPLAAARRVVRRALEIARGDLRSIDFEHVAAVLALVNSAHGHGRVHLPGVEVLRSFDWVRFGIPAARTQYLLPAIPPFTFGIPGTNCEISLELIEKSETSGLFDCVYNDGMGCLDWGRLSGSLQLRNWQTGDRYQPAGHSGERKIKTLFQQARIPFWERRQWPVLVDGQAVVWARQFGPASAVVANAGSSMILRIRESEVQ
jgi:tRNA(Ile)-lysidine synthase